MHRPSWTAPLLVALAFLFLVDVADATPRRRRSSSYRSYNYSYSYSTGYPQIAAKVDGESNYHPLKVYADYDRAKAPEVAFADKIRVHLHVWDQQLLSAEQPLMAEVRFVDLSNSEQEHTRIVPVTLSEVDGTNANEYKLGVFELTNDPAAEPLVQPARVYRLFVNLHRAAEEYNETTAWGRVPGPYYVATSGESVLEQARQRIVMRTFREWYYTERGWNRNAQYPMDCHAYYCWATGICTVNARNGWSNPDSLFSTFHGSGDLPRLMEKGPLHGDYVRIPGHTFMLLAYDAARQQVWTMEANFNSTIEICLRSLGSGWSVGHLAEHHIASDLFQVASKQKEEDMMAQGPMPESQEPTIMTQ